MHHPYKFLMNFRSSVQYLEFFKSSKDRCAEGFRDGNINDAIYMHLFESMNFKVYKSICEGEPTLADLNTSSYMADKFCSNFVQWREVNRD